MKVSKQIKFYDATARPHQPILRQVVVGLSAMECCFPFRGRLCDGVLPFFRKTAEQSD